MLRYPFQAYCGAVYSVRVEGVREGYLLLLDAEAEG